MSTQTVTDMMEHGLLKFDRRADHQAARLQDSMDFITDASRQEFLEGRRVVGTREAKASTMLYPLAGHADPKASAGP